METLTSIEYTDICCQICFFEFESDEKCPRILSCGHSFCHSCIRKLINESAVCPNCNDKICFQAPEEMTINYFLKSISQKMSKANNLDSELDDLPEAAAYPCQLSVKKKVKKKDLPFKGHCESHSLPNHLKCLNCNKYICGTCFYLEHKECSKVLPITDAMRIQKTAKTQKVELIENRLEKKRKKLDKELSALTKEYEKMKRDIDDKQYLKQEGENFARNLEHIKSNFLEANCSLELEEADSNLEDLLKKFNLSLPTAHRMAKSVLREMTHEEFLHSIIYVEINSNQEKKFSKIGIHDHSVIFGELQNVMHEKGLVVDILDFLQLKIKICSCKPQKFFSQYSSELHIPNFPLCSNMYGRLETGKDKNIRICSFRSQWVPQEGELTVDLNNLLRTLEINTALPQEAFLKIYGKGEVIIKVDSFCPRGVNFLLYCSGLLGRTRMLLGRALISFPHQVEGGQFNGKLTSSVVDGIRDEETYKTQQIRGFVEGHPALYPESQSFFLIVKQTDPSVSLDAKFGEVTLGMDVVDRINTNDAINECGLIVIL